MPNYLSSRGEVYLDFEFNRVTHEKVNLVSAVTECAETGVVTKWWLHNNKKKQKSLRRYLRQFSKVTAFAATAEGRSFIALGLDPFKFQWFDLHVEWRMLTNHNDALQYGKQLVDGKVKNTRKPKPKWERTEEDIGQGFKNSHSLAEMEYKLTGKIRDTDHKAAMRDLIISDPKKFSKKERKWILEYNADDVVNLKNLKKETISWNMKLNPSMPLERYMKGAFERGSFMAATAWMETWGYPINYEATKNFSKQVPNIFYDVQREINELFPDIKPFKWNKAQGRYSWNQKATREWIEMNCDVEKWMKTKKGQLSLALEAFTQHFDFKHSYPKDNFGAQVVRFLKLKQNLYGFRVVEDSDTKTFWSSVGPDKMVRPYLNPFKAQSSRSQPASTGFMFLKPAWMRALVEPPEGHYICGIDWSSQEFLISALLSEDMAMINAYLSGDPYLFFAKEAGAVPRDGKREDHEEARDAFKSTTLGLSYLMTRVGLAVKLTTDTKKEWTEDAAQEMIDLFYDLYYDLGEYQKQVEEDYASGNPIILDDGWTMWTDNENVRSVGNCPIQGAGAVAMRRACVSAMRDHGVRVLFPLHDALYFMGKLEDMEREIVAVRKAMRKAFISIAPKHLKKFAKAIRSDAHAWSRELPDGHFFIEGHGMKKPFKVVTSKLYIDKRSKVEYDQFSKYFLGRAEDEL